MPYTEEHKQRTRKRIIQTARRLFNRKTKKKAAETQPPQNGDGAQPIGDGATLSDG